MCMILPQKLGPTEVKGAKLCNVFVAAMKPSKTIPSQAVTSYSSLASCMDFVHILIVYHFDVIYVFNIAGVAICWFRS